MPYGMGESKKKDAVWRQKEARIILFKFNAVAERRQWSSAASIPRRKSLAKIVPPFLRCKCSFAPDLPFAQRFLVQRAQHMTGWNAQQTTRSIR